MGIGWNRTIMTFVVLLMGSILMLMPVAIAAVGSGGTGDSGGSSGAGGPAVSAGGTSEKKAGILKAGSGGP